MHGDTLQPKFTLQDLGYHFNSAGELRQLRGNEPFKFTTQEDYEMLGDAMTHEIFDLLEKLGLQRRVMKKPQDTRSDAEYSFIYTSPDYENKSTILVLIHGSGAVRAGQWARKLILNDNLDRGSQLPYIERALENDWGVVVLNANNNANIINGVPVPLQYSKTSAMHVKNAWYRYLKYAKATRIHIVAHSRGGEDVSKLLEEFPTENRIQVVCLTDSWCNIPEDRAEYPLVINWAARPYYTLNKPQLGDRIPRSTYPHQIWAGTNEHEVSSCMAIDSIFFVLENYYRICLDQLLVHAWEMIEGPSISENNAVLSEECAENLENEERPAKRFKMTEKEDKDLDKSGSTQEEFIVQEDAIITEFNVSGDVEYCQGSQRSIINHNNNTPDDHQTHMNI